MNPYRVVIAGLDDDVDIDEVPVTTLQYTDALDDIGACSFEVSKKSPKAVRSILEPGERIVKILRDQDDLRWSGTLTVAAIGSDSDTVKVAAAGWFDWFDERYVDDDLDFTDEDQFDIAWDLISYTQAKTLGDLGITRWTGETPSGVTRTLSYLAEDRTKIQQALKDMAGADDGFDFEITADRIWKVYAHKGVDSNAVFELGKNVKAYAYAIDATGIATDLTGIGSGTGTDKLLSVASDAVARARFLRHELAVTYSDVDDQDLLDGLTAAELANRKGPQEVPALTLQIDVDADPTTYQTGDTVIVRIDDGFDVIDGRFRISAKTVTVDTEGQETVTLAFESNVAA